MTKKETITSLCEIITEVGAAMKHECAHDCFCTNEEHYFQMDKKVIDFVRTAVNEKIKKEFNFSSKIKKRKV